MSNAPGRFVALDSWRGIAACAIALIHFKIGVNSHVGELPFLARAGSFVDFFFVLSGFVIFANYAQRLSNGFSFFRFMLMRFGRLYPLHIFVLAIYVGFEWLQVTIPQLGALAIYEPFSQEGETLGFIISSLFLVQAMGLYNDNIIAFSGPSWSISTEFYAYALFAAMLIVLKKHIKIALLVTFLVSGGFLYASETYLITTLKYGFLRCVYGFSAGAMLWYIFASYKDRIASLLQSPKIWSVIESLLIAFLFVFLSYLSRGAYQMLVVPLFMVIVFVFAFERGIFSKILQHKFCVLLGTLSYSIYLLHSFIAGKAASVARYVGKHFEWNMVSVSENGEHMIGATIWQGDLFTLAYLVLVVACSYITYKIVETPGREYFRRLAQKKKAKP